MALSPEALGRLQDYAERGGFEPVLSVGVSDRTPEAGSEVTVTWDLRDLGADHGLLRVDDVAWQVRTAGEHVIAVGGRDITVTLAAVDQVASATIRPRVVIPVIEVLAVDGLSLAGSPVRIRWQTHRAEACDLRIQLGDGVILQEEVEPSGEREVCPARAGVLTARLVARSVHARFGARAICDQELRVHIAAPPVRLDTSARFIEARFGEEVRFSWTAEGAATVRLRAVERGRAFRLETTGEVHITGGLLEETFILEAEGLDGQAHAREVRVTPAPPDLSFPIDLMRELDRPWAENFQ